MSMWKRLRTRIIRNGKTRRIPPNYKPQLEKLEDRLVPATTAQINTAITNALAYLAALQDPTTGKIDSGSGNPVADTAQSIQAMEIKGNIPGGGEQYSVQVQLGLNYLFNNVYNYYAGTDTLTPLNVQTYGDPTTSVPAGNGFGILIADHIFGVMYEEGITMSAIAASGTPSRVVGGTGPLAGMTYKQVLTDMVDYCAWAQIDSNISTTNQGEGAWYYTPTNNAAQTGDGSVTQWPVLGMLAAEQAPWNIQPPAFVKTELNKWVTFNQGADGGSNYNFPGGGIGEDVAKTGGLLVQFKFLGDTPTTPRDVLALSYINNNWNFAVFGGWYGNYGNPYAMFAAFKGLELMGYQSVSSVTPDGATPSSAAGDWYGSYADYLANSSTTVFSGTPNHQNTDGSWNPNFVWDKVLSTAWYADILQKTVFHTEQFNLTTTTFFPYRPNFQRPSFSVLGWVQVTNNGPDITNNFTVALSLPRVGIQPLGATVNGVVVAFTISSNSGKPFITISGLKHGQSEAIFVDFTYPASLSLDGIRKALQLSFS
jgi:hypothetical protein